LGFNLNLQKDLWKFGLPNVPALFFLYIIEFSGRKVIEVYRGMEEAGLFSAGYKMGMFMAIVTTAFRFAWQPFLLTEAKNEGAERTFARVFTYFYAVTGYLFMIFVMFAVDLVKMKIPGVSASILDPTYWVGMSVFPLILLAHFFDGLTANFTVGIYIKNKTQIVPLINGAGAIFNLGMNMLVIPRYGMMGAAWVTAGSFLIMTLLLYFYINRHYPIPYEWLRVLKCTIAVGVPVVVYFCYPGGIWWRLILLVSTPVLLVGMKFFYKEEVVRAKMVLRLQR
jgi:O-antigen/teichoic acid export membrane protein